MERDPTGRLRGTTPYRTCDEHSEIGDDTMRERLSTERPALARLSGPALVVACAAWIVGSTYLLARDPLVGTAVGLAPIVLFFIVRNSVVRFLFVVVGGLLVLGSSGDLSANKIVYAGLLVLCAAVSIGRLILSPPTYARHFKSLIWFGLALLAIIALSYLASPAGSDLGTFGRQAIFYLLIVLGPAIGLDAGRDIPPRMTYPLVGVLGVVAAVGFAFDWLDRRGVTALSSGRFILSSLLLPAFAFSLSLVMVFLSERRLARVLWLIPIVGIPIAMLVTGTRTNLIVFAAIFAVLGVQRRMRVPPLKMLGLLVVAGVVAGFVFPIVASVAVSDPDFLQRRIQASLTVLNGDGSADQSYAIRQNAYAIATALVDQSPVFGMGLGYTIPITLDTPLLTIVRLGWLGTLGVAAFIAAMGWSIWKATRAIGPSPATTAWWGFLLVLLFNIPFGTPLEDRGFGFTLLLATVAIASGLHATTLQDRPAPVVERAPSARGVSRGATAATRGGIPT
ncbi:O-antigen ligase family protein [Clavibacter tessellarius]|uniref:O-antigen ligase family protein n=1 Tax=Clavibacter tessellarius TaxID=31965 RepID=UPI0039E9E53A